jgi:hypothetical protein
MMAILAPPAGTARGQILLFACQCHKTVIFP